MLRRLREALLIGQHLKLQERCARMTLITKLLGGLTLKASSIPPDRIKLLKEGR